MPRPPLARERVLDAFEDILVHDGERAATLEAVAKAAGVSKGGLLYHFASKEELAAGILDRLEEQMRLDEERMATAPEGPVAYFIRTSVMTDDPLDRVIVATSRLAQGGHSPSVEALSGIRKRWAAGIRPHVRDQAALDLVLLVSDGLYFNNALTPVTTGVSATVPTGAALDALIELVLRAAT